MKKRILATVMALSTYAFANDGGMPYIQVENLTLKKVEVGSSITFEGKEAESLFNALPSMTIYGLQRGFTATGKQKAVSIVCEGKYLDPKSDHDRALPRKGGPICKITVERAFKGSGGDDSKWVNDREPQSEKSTDKKDKK